MIIKGNKRIEKDSMGDMEVPEEALYGASTQRAVLNFPISGHRMPEDFIRCIGLLKLACARANGQLGLMDAKKVELIEKVALEIYEGKLSEHFPIDVFQTGSCTSSNMNANEVIANRVSFLEGEAIGSKKPVHPNDDVNMGQSSNDTMPTALHLSLVLALRDKLIPALGILAEELEAKAKSLSGIVKIGRTHLMDATPITLGQEFSGYARQIRKAIMRAQRGMEALRELAIGGTAVGTGINAHPEFAQKVVAILSQECGFDFIEAENHFEAQAARDDCVEVVGCLSAVASSLSKIANDIRMLASGPRSGLGEIQIPSTQPGSSIMPGKVNPVMSEMLVQASMYAMGLTQSVNIAGRDGHFELNVTIPLIAYALLDSIKVLSEGAKVFAQRCIHGIEADEEKCKEFVDRSLMLVTALNPIIGYDKAAYVAKKAFNENKTLREVILEEKLVEESKLDQVLDPKSMV